MKLILIAIHVYMWSVQLFWMDHVSTCEWLIIYVICIYLQWQDSHHWPNSTLILVIIMVWLVRLVYCLRVWFPAAVLSWLLTPLHEFLKCFKNLEALYTESNIQPSWNSIASSSQLSITWKFTVYMRCVRVVEWMKQALSSSLDIWEDIIKKYRVIRSRTYAEEK